jgi:hypothetical protein
MNFTVPVSSCPLLRDPPFLLALFWLAGALGYRALKILRVPIGRISTLEAAIVSIAAGLGLLQFVPFTLGATGHLTPSAIAACLALLCILLAGDMIHVARAAWKRARAPREPMPWWVVAGLLLLLVPIVRAGLEGCRPPWGVDEMGYHLAAPKRWLQHGSLCYLPTLIHTQGSLGVEMLFTIPLALWSDTAARLIHFGMGVLGLGALFAVGRRLRGPGAGLAAAWIAAIGLPRYLSFEYAGTADVDMGVALQILCAVLAWLISQDGKDRRWLTCSALFAGFAASFKLTAVFIIPVMSVLRVAGELKRGAPKLRAVASSMDFAFVAALPVIPWLARNAALLGNPFFPAMGSIWPTRDWAASADHAMQIYFRYYNADPGVMADWTLAHRMILVWSLAFALPLLSIGLCVMWRDADARRLMAIAAPLLEISLITTGVYPRLMMHGLCIVSLLAGLALAAPLAKSRVVRLAALACMLFYSTQYARHVDWGQDLRVATGTTRRDDYLNRTLEIYPLWQYVNRNTPPKARVLCAALSCSALQTGGVGYYSDRDVLVTDAYLQRRIRLDKWDDFLADLRRDRIAYLVIHPASRSMLPGPAYAPAGNELPFSRRLAADYGALAYRSGEQELYSLVRLYERPQDEAQRSAAGGKAAGVRLEQEGEKWRGE